MYSGLIAGNHECDVVLRHNCNNQPRPQPLCTILQVKAILLGDSLGWTLTSRDVDLPELQGEPDDIARDKCQLASERVRITCVVLLFNMIIDTYSICDA